MASPFHDFQKLRPGHGLIHLALLPPSLPRLRTVEYQYPLKLVSPAPVKISTCDIVHTVYLLTYGGGLVAGDAIDLSVIIEGARLVLLTQGSTKLFKSTDRQVISKQNMTVTLQPGSSLCYLPDPVQPFEHSSFEQKQIYNIHNVDGDAMLGSLCVLDWVSNGRSANGENWSFCRYASCNEVNLVKANGNKTLLLKDSLLLDDHTIDSVLTARMHGMAIIGTFILFGQQYSALMQFMLNEFKLQPRVGGRTWESESTGDGTHKQHRDAQQTWRDARHTREQHNGLLWSAAHIRGVVVVKFCAKELEHARQWLRDMLEAEGTVVRHFGERALLCL